MLSEECSNKQTIYLKSYFIHYKTIEALKRGSRYKLFKFDIQIDKISEEGSIKMVYFMLDEIPGLEISKVIVPTISNDFINTFMQKSSFTNKQDFFKVLECVRKSFSKQSEPYEYIPKVSNIENYDMS